MRELIRPGDIARSIDVREARLQKPIHLDRLAGRHAEFLEPVALQVRNATDSDEQGVEVDADFASFVLGEERLRTGTLVHVDLDALDFVTEQNVDALGSKALLDERGHFGVFAQQQSRRHLDERDAAAQACERLRHLAPDRPAAEHREPLGSHAQRPECVGGQRLDLLDTRDRRDERPRAGSDHDAARRQHALAAVVTRDLDLPRRNDACLAEHDVHAEGGVALDRVVWGDRRDHTLYALHDIGEVELGARRTHAEFLRALDLRDESRRTDEGL